MTANEIHPPSGHVALTLDAPGLPAALLLLTLWAAPTAAEPGPGDVDADAPDCEWTCVRWARQCSVDPRGVRRCRRGCEKFAEICPPPDPPPATAEPPAGAAP